MERLTSAAFVVFLGGGLGAVSRWLTGLFLMRAFGARSLYGILCVNLVGCFLAGLLFRLLPHETGNANLLRLTLLTGFLGGFTTFSAFSLDVVTLWFNSETSAAALAFVIGVIGTLCGAFAGLWLGQWFLK